LKAIGYLNKCNNKISVSKYGFNTPLLRKRCIFDHAMIEKCIANALSETIQVWRDD